MPPNGAGNPISPQFAFNMRVCLFLLTLLSTVLYSPLILIGLFDLVKILQSFVGIKNTMVMSFQIESATMGALGLLGITGLWLSWISYVRLQSRLSTLTGCTVFLLAAGIIGALLFIWLMATSNHKIFEWWNFLLVCGPLIATILISAILIYKFTININRSQ